MTIKEQLTKLEQDANNLVNNLAELRETAGHYREAKTELNKTNENLINLIQSTE